MATDTVIRDIEHARRVRDACNAAGLGCIIYRPAPGSALATFGYAYIVAQKSMEAKFRSTGYVPVDDDGNDIPEQETVDE